MYMYYSDICIVDNEQSLPLMSTATIRMRAQTLCYHTGVYLLKVTTQGIDNSISHTMLTYPAASYATLNSAILPSTRTRLICLNPLSFVVYGGLEGSEYRLDCVFNNSDIRYLTGRAMRSKKYWVLHGDRIHLPVTWDSVSTQNIPTTLVGTPIARRTTGFMFSKISAEMLYQVIKKCR